MVIKRLAVIENSEGLGSYFTRSLATDRFEIFPVWRTSQLPQEGFDAYIFTGDHHNISDGLLPIHKKEVEFIRSLEGKRIFASCFFHQLLGQAFGGKVQRRGTRFLGWHRMDIIKGHQVLDGLDGPFFLNLNVDEIKIRAERAEVLATSEDCKYQVLKYGDDILTCQCHPEILKQEALELIALHREGLMDGCPDIDEKVKETEGSADDGASALFLSNIIEWLIP